MSELSKMIANLVRMQITDPKERLVVLAEAMGELVGVSPVPVQANRQEAQPAQSVAPKRTILARKGQICSCSSCSRDVYKLDQDLPDGIKMEEFVAYFVPVNHGVPLPPEIKLIGDRNWAATDCPLCNGELTLTLWGKAPQDKRNEPDVGSIDPRSLGAR